MDKKTRLDARCHYSPRLFVVWCVYTAYTGNNIRYHFPVPGPCLLSTYHSHIAHAKITYI
jgi:hypothetical protein